MTIYQIQSPKLLNVAIRLPSSKSICNRVLILNALCSHPKSIHNLSVCDDTEAVVKALSNKQEIIDVSAAGTAMRFLTAYFAGQPGFYIITGTERMKNRPVKILVDALRTVGAHIDYLEKEGFPPLRIQGQKLMGGETTLDGSVSSQYISALLMVAPTMTEGLRLHLTGRISSKPYIAMTVQLMRQFGAAVYEKGQTFIVPPLPYTAINNFTVEADWSAASYWYEIVALSNDREASVSLTGLYPDSLQGDASIVYLFDLLGVQTLYTKTGIALTKKPLAQEGLFQFDFSSMPDMAQTFAVTCAALQIPFRFQGLHSLKIKETDRLTALQTELRKLGYLLEIENDNTLFWNGDRCEAESSPVIATYDDHRMAMAFAPLSLCFDKGIQIANPEVVTKSYPTFWDDLKKADFFSYFCGG